MRPSIWRRFWSDNDDISPQVSHSLGIRGMAAYAYHARSGKTDDGVDAFFVKRHFAALLLPSPLLTFMPPLTLEVGEVNLKCIFFSTAQIRLWHLVFQLRFLLTIGQVPSLLFPP